MNFKSTIVFCFLFFTTFFGGATTYYTILSGHPGTTSNWNSNPAGGGATPGNFTTSGDIFIIQGTGGLSGAPHNMTTTSTWTLGNGVTLQVQGGAVLQANNAVTINAGGTFILDSVATYNHNHTTAYATGILQGTENFHVNSNFVILNSSSTGPGTPANGGFGNLTINSNNSSSVNCAGAMTNIKGNLTVIKTGNSATIEFRLTGNTALALNVLGNLDIQGGIFTIGNGTATPSINLSGDFSMSGGELKNLASNNPNIQTLNFVKSGTQNFIKTGGIITAVTSSGRTLAFIVNSGSVLNMSTYVLDNAAPSTATFAVVSGGGLKLGSPDGISSTGATGNVQVSGSRAFDPGASYEYNGSVAQITGIGLPSSVKVLSLNNSVYETITLTNSVNIDDSLSLQKGFLLTTSAIILNLRDTTVIGSVNSNFNTFGAVNNIGWERSFVKGPVRIDISSTTDKWIPVGKITGTDTLFAPVKLVKANSNPVADTIEYFPTPYIDTAADAGTIKRVSNVEYWKINCNSAVIADLKAKVTLSWRPKSGVGDGVNNAQALDDLVIAHYLDAGSSPFLWYIEGADLSIMPKGSGSTVNYGILSTNQSNSPYTDALTSPYFTLASKSFFNLLPLKLLSFNGYASVRAITLNWKTAEEKNVANFELQKSTDGINFYPLTTTIAFNSIGVNNYSETDINPVNGINYYRLKIKDNTQKISYSPVTKIKFENQAVINLYPNPVKDKLTLNHDKAGNFTFVKIVSVSGNEIFTQKIISGQQQSVLELNNLPGGWYILKFINGNNIINKAFYKQ